MTKPLEVLTLLVQEGKGLTGPQQEELEDRVSKIAKGLNLPGARRLDDRLSRVLAVDVPRQEGVSSAMISTRFADSVTKGHSGIMVRRSFPGGRQDTYDGPGRRSWSPSPPGVWVPAWDWPVLKAA